MLISLLLKKARAAPHLLVARGRDPTLLSRLAIPRDKEYVKIVEKNQTDFLDLASDFQFSSCKYCL